MAVKEIPIVIKVDGKQLDVLKTSVNEFEKVYSEAQKKLNSLPLGSEEWKTLNNDIKNADKTFQQTKEILIETEGKFKSLKVQIRQATVAFQEAEEKGDIKSMKKLKKDLDDLNDQFELTTLKSMKFEDALATMPGVAGFVGQSIQGVDKAFKVLAANPVLAIVTALVGAFTFLKEAMGKTKAGQDALNKVSQAFSTVMGPVLALINTVAIPIFEKLAWVIGKVGEGFAWAAEKLGVAKKDIAAATKDVDKVGEEAAKKEEERKEKEAQRLEKLKQQREKDAADRKQKAEEAKKLAQDTININESLKQSEDELARAKKKASEDPIQAMKDEQTEKDQDYVREKKRIEDLKKVKGTTVAEQKALTTELNNLEKEYLKDKSDRTKEINKQEMDIVEKKKEANDLIYANSLKAIKDETERQKAERQLQFSDEEKKYKDLLDKKIITKSQYDKAIKDSQTALNNDLTAIDDKKAQEDREKQLKKLDDDLKFLQLKGETMRAGTKSFYDNQREILLAAEKREMQDLDDKAIKEKMTAEEVERQKTLIKEKNVKLRKDLDQQELLSYMQTASQIVGVGTQITAALGAIYENQMNAELKAAGDNQEKQEAIKKDYFERNKKLQIANATIQMFQSAISAFSSLAVIPIVGPALGAVAAAAAIALGIANINKIKSTQYQSAAGGASASGESAAPPNYGKNYGDGGLIDGPRHSEGGVPLTAEGGEAIMTRGAVTMFAPILSALNQMGGGTSFSKGASGQASYDNPKASSTETQSPVILKTYVVSNELTTEQQKQARLKDLSTL